MDHSSRIEPELNAAEIAAEPTSEELQLISSAILGTIPCYHLFNKFFSYVLRQQWKPSQSHSYHVHHCGRK